MMPEGAVRVAVVGTGYIADYHARAIQQLPDAYLAAICSRTEEGAASFAAKYGVAPYTQDFEVIVTDPTIDAVVIATPNAYHLPYSIAALDAGKHVLVEKPMAMNAAEAAMVADRVAQTGRNFLVGHMWRFDPEVTALRDFVASGAIGQVVKTKGYGIHKHWGPEGWFQKHKLAGGGALIDMGVHAIDTVRFLLGDPEPVEVYAKVDTHYGDYDVDDSGILMITWSNGTTSLIESGWWHPHMDGPEASTQLFGTKGYANLFPTRYELTREKEEKSFAVRDRSEHCDQLIYDRQMAQFVADIKSGSASVPGVQEGLWIMKITDAAYESAKTGKVVKYSR